VGDDVRVLSFDPSHAGLVGGAIKSGDAERYPTIEPRIPGHQRDIDGAVPYQDVDRAVVMTGLVAAARRRPD